jgi:putative ABC transport system permease protein
MWRLVIRSLAAHKARLAMTLVAVCLGTAFVASSLIFTDSTGRAADPETLGNALLGFAGIAVLVGSFVIANTFSMLVGQRTRELALLRAVGMSRWQVRRMVLGEAAAVGLVGGVAGIAAGYGFAVLAVRLLDDTAGPAPVVVGWAALLVPLALAVGVTLLSAWASARRAARTTPVAALRADTTSLQRGLRRRNLAGAIVAAPGLAVYGYAALTDQIDEQVGIVGLGVAALLILAVALLAPALCRLLLGPLSAPLGHLGAIGRLAAGNARRNPRRTAATASALMISLSVVTGLAIFGDSVKRHTVTPASAATWPPSWLSSRPAAGTPPSRSARSSGWPGCAASRRSPRCAMPPCRCGPARSAPGRR